MEDISAIINESVYPLEILRLWKLLQCFRSCLVFYKNRDDDDDDDDDDEDEDEDEEEDAVSVFYFYFWCSRSSLRPHLCQYILWA